MQPTVEPEWLAERLSDPGVRVLAAPWYMAAVHKRDAVQDFSACRIKGSGYFDVDGIAEDTSASSTLPHMLPAETGFAAAMDALGITNDTTVVLYDYLGVYSAPRVWWTFKVFGHEKVAVLNGGLPAWQAKGLPTEAGPVAQEALLAATRACRSPPAGAPRYSATLDRSKVRSLGQMVSNSKARQEQVVDARSLGRFTGKEPEPRAGLKGGHIPGARCLPFPALLKDGRLKPQAEIAEAFVGAGLDVHKPIVATCGSGLTACILALGLYEATGNLAAVYDGSWSEYGAHDDVPISALAEDP